MNSSQRRGAMRQPGVSIRIVMVSQSVLFQILSDLVTLHETTFERCTSRIIQPPHLEIPGFHFT